MFEWLMKTKTKTSYHFKLFYFVDKSIIKNSTEAKNAQYRGEKHTHFVIEVFCIVCENVEKYIVPIEQPTGPQGSFSCFPDTGLENTLPLAPVLVP